MTEEKTNRVKEFVDRWPVSALYISVVVTIILCVQMVTFVWRFF